MIFGKSGDSSFVTLQWLATGVQMARRIGRVEFGEGTGGIGTGFLLETQAIDPALEGPPIFLTRDYVLAPNSTSDRLSVRDLAWRDAAVVFQGSDESAFTRHRFRELVAFDPNLRLAALVLESPPQGLAPIKVAPTPPLPGYPVYVVGYPLGGGLQLALRDNECLGVEELRGSRKLLYRAATQGGSSGSPVFNGLWGLIAVHAGGDRQRQANFGTPITDLLAALRDALRSPAEGTGNYATLPPEKSAAAATKSSQEYYSAFLSYSHDDKPFAARLFKELRARGVAVWWDQVRMRVGDDIYARINEMRKTDKVILCCSESSLTSLWVDNELKLALSKERKLREGGADSVSIVLPLDLDGYLGRWKGALSAQFVSRNFADFVGWDKDDDKFEAGIQSVVRALEVEKQEDEFPEPRLI
jgi:hypothetical protein